MMGSKIKVLCAALALAFCASARSASTLEIRTMSQDGYTGKFNISNAVRPGMMVEIIHAIERMDPALKFSGLDVLGTLKRIEYFLDSGSIDVFFGLAMTERRIDDLIFIYPPLYQTTYQLAARMDDTAKIEHFEDLRRLDGVGIVLVNASEHYIQDLTAQGLALDQSGVSTVINLKKLIHGRGRYYFASTLSIVEEIAAMNVADTVKLLPAKFFPTDVYVVFSKQAPTEMIMRVRKALSALEKSGELKQIVGKYGVR